MNSNQNVVKLNITLALHVMDTILTEMFISRALVISFRKKLLSQFNKAILRTQEGAHGERSSESSHNINMS